MGDYVFYRNGVPVREKDLGEFENLPDEIPGWRFGTFCFSAPSRSPAQGSRSGGARGTPRHSKHQGRLRVDGVRIK